MTTWCANGVRWARCGVVLGVAVLLSACETLSQVPNVEVAKAPEKIEYPQQAQQAAPVAATGSLFAASTYRPGFEDQRARLVGDSLTIRIEETLTASQKSGTNVSRESEMGMGVTSLPLLSPTSSLVGKLQAGANTNNSLNSSGDTTIENGFRGSVTATVVEVLPNGHLNVVGEKQIGVNQNVEVLKFSGTVNPRNIRADNSVSSAQISNVRVLSRGRGAQNDAQTFGWLSRFFLTLLPF
jgi:flagellar L-ring protein FlgH